MKIVTQNLKDGKTSLLETPMPRLRPNGLLIATECSLISPGTERMLIEFGKSNLISKAKQQPEKLAQVLSKMQTDGIKPTIEAVFRKLDTPLPLGYSNVGKVVAVGNNVEGFKIGDRVLSNGHHSEIIYSPKNLTAHIPDGVSNEDALFTVIGSIALQAVRLAKPTIGETFSVYGLGLVGLMVCQILSANGCKVIGLDYNSKRLDMAHREGVKTINLNNNKNPIPEISNLTNGVGVDGVIIATATQSSEPIDFSAQMCRKLGRVILVGTSGLKLKRDDFFKKEIKLQVSASYGPGRYDASYEENGNDYPIGYVRWTEKRNFEAVLELIKTKKLNTYNYVTHRFSIDNFDKAFQVIFKPNVGLGVILEYEPQLTKKNNTVKIPNRKSSPVSSHNEKNLGETTIIIGAGNHTKTIILPALKKIRAKVNTIVSNEGLSSTHLAHKFGIPNSSTDVEASLKNDKINNVIICSRHSSHFNYTIQCLKSGKNVFVEKPLCLTLEELETIKNTFLQNKNKKNILMVGFNRSFSPLVTALRKSLPDNSPTAINILVNAGQIPSEHWIHDTKVGGGRILGEACHFIELAREITGSKIVSHTIHTMNNITKDTVTISLSFLDGSICNINYFSNGNLKLPKERIEVFSNNRVAVIDNFKTLRYFGWHGKKNINLFNQNKGHKEILQYFYELTKNPIQSDEYIEKIFEVHDVAIKLQNQIC